MRASISANPHVAGSVSPDAIAQPKNLEFHEFAYEHFYGRLQLQTFLYADSVVPIGGVVWLVQSPGAASRQEVSESLFSHGRTTFSGLPWFLPGFLGEDCSSPSRHHVKMGYVDSPSPVMRVLCAARFFFFDGLTPCIFM